MSDQDPNSPGQGMTPSQLGPSQPATPPPPQPAYPPGQPQSYQPQQLPGTNGLAVASFILGLLWICYIGSILGVIFGHVALAQIKKTNGTQGGSGLAIAGLVLGYLGIAVLIFTIITGAATLTFNA